MSERTWAFTEKSFYLAEFRGRSVGVALPGPAAVDGRQLRPVLDELAANGTRTVLMTPARSALGEIAEIQLVRDAEPDWVARLWRTQRAGRRAALELDRTHFEAACRDVALRLRLAKLVWLDARGALLSDDGARISVVDVADLDRMLAKSVGVGDRSLLAAVREMLAGGLPSVSLCSPEGLADELFTYAGSGTFFTRERYADVRALALDDFDAAADLISKGVEEGYLAPREESEQEALLASAFGVFIEGRYLAGIGSLIPYPKERAGEIAGLYTLTRFVGEGVGGHLVRFAIESALEAGYEFVFACTTSDRVVQFFERHGFSVVEPENLPASKWESYASERRQKLRCLRRDVQED